MPSADPRTSRPIPRAAVGDRPRAPGAGGDRGRGHPALLHRRRRACSTASAPTSGATGGRGQVLAPWPNRLGDGRYEFGGRAAQAAARRARAGNAIHGLVRWLPWRVEAHAQNVVVLALHRVPRPRATPSCSSCASSTGWVATGLTVSTTATNAGEVALPFGLGFHPYLAVGDGPGRHRRPPPAGRPSGWWSTTAALPTGEVRPVAGTEFDFTDGRPIGPTRLDTAFTGLQRDGDGPGLGLARRPRRASGRRPVGGRPLRLPHVLTPATPWATRAPGAEPSPSSR